MTTLREFLADEYTTTAAEDDLRRAIKRGNEAMDYLTREQRRLESGIKWRKARGKEHLVSKWEADLAVVLAQIEDVQAGFTRDSVALDALREQRRDARTAVMESVLAGIIDDLGFVGEDVIIYPRPTGYTAFDVHLWDGTMTSYHSEDCTTGRPGYRLEGDGSSCAGCDPSTFKNNRFGYDATVYGPQIEWSGRISAGVRAAGEPKVNWGTLGSLSIADANDMVRVHQVAISLAEIYAAALDAYELEALAA